MKYLSLIAIIVILQLTWWFSQKDKALTKAQQNRLLAVIKEYMTQAVKKKDPQASGIEFSNLYTETVEPGRVIKAHFKFSYFQNSETEFSNKVYRKGHFLVTSRDGIQWKAQIDEVNDVQVEFIDPFPVEGTIGAAPEPEPESAAHGDEHGAADSHGHKEDGHEDHKDKAAH